MQSFVNKSKRVKFEVTIRVLDLNNVPLVSGTSFIKWHLPSSTAAEHRGRTNKCQIRDHKVNYDYDKTTTVRLHVGKDGMLQDCAIEFEVLQEYSSGGKGERIRLGQIRLNLAEYVEASEAQSPSREGPSDEGVLRRYLMQDSKINSTLKIGVYMRHIEGTRDYYAPPLRTAPVFGGIAGIIHNSEPVSGIATASGLPSQNPSGAIGDNEEGMPSVNLSSTNKEVGEMQDMYRRTLAAYWASQPGELRADESIEDIFSGGDGWGKGGRPPSSVGVALSGTGDADASLDPDHLKDQPHHRRHHHHHHHEHGQHRRHHEDDEDEDGRTGWRPGPLKPGGVTARPNVGMRYNRRGPRTNKPGKPDPHEVDEFGIREDIRSWRVRESAYG